MINQIIAGFRMHKNVEPLTVQHQPGHELREQGDIEGNLIHGYGVRADRHIMPATEPHRKILGNLFPDFCGHGLCRGPVIDMGVIAADKVFRRYGHLGIP